jgi:hypothetical protein
MRPLNYNKTGMVLLPPSSKDDIYTQNSTKDGKKIELLSPELMQMKDGKKIELLSPELMQTIKKCTKKTNPSGSNQQEHQQQQQQQEKQSTHSSYSKYKALENFDFDSFTVQSLRTAELAHLQTEVDQLEHLFDRSVLLDTASTCDTISIGTSAADDLVPMERTHSHPQRRTRSNSSLLLSRPQGFGPQLNSGGRQPQTQSRPRMCGWLYRLHHGRLMMVKRWRLQYCLLKGGKLCVYTTEDTINGKLKACFRILSVYTEEKTLFLHVIGENSNGDIWHETFRARDQFSYQDWTFHLREFIMVDQRPTIDLGVDMNTNNNQITNEIERRHSSVHLNPHLHHNYPHPWSSTRRSSTRYTMDNFDEDDAFDFSEEEEDDFNNNNLMMMGVGVLSPTSIVHRYQRQVSSSNKM